MVWVYSLVCSVKLINASFSYLKKLYIFKKNITHNNSLKTGIIFVKKNKTIYLKKLMIFYYIYHLAFNLL